MKDQTKEMIRAVMILNEINVDVARIIPGDKFQPLQEKIDEVRQIVLESVFPPNPTINELVWSEISKT
jgi:hypothetical protein